MTFLFHNSGIKIAKKIPRNGNADGKCNKLNLFFLSFLLEKVLTELIALRAMSPEREKKKKQSCGYDQKYHPHKIYRFFSH